MNLSAEDLLLSAIRTMVRDEIAEALRTRQDAPRRVEGFISTREAASRASVRQSTILSWIGDGRLPATKPEGSKGWRIRPADLERLLTGEQGRGEPPANPLDLTAERGRRLAESLREGLKGPSR